MFFQEGRRQEWTRWTTGLAACAALAGAGSAEALDADQILSYNAGRFLIQPQLDLISQYTGNLFYASQNPQPGGLVPIDIELAPGLFVPVEVLTPPGTEVEPDLLWYVSPGLEIQYGLNPENSLTLKYFHDSIFYIDHSEFDAGQDRIEFDANAQFRRFTVTGTDNVAWLDTIIGGSSATTRRTPISRLVWTDRYNVTYDATMKTDVYVGFNHDLNEYLQPVNLYDQGTIGGSLGGTYKPSERIGIFIEGAGGHTEVTANLPPSPPTTPPPPGYPLPPYQVPGNNSFVLGGFVGARGNFTPRIDGTVKVGYEIRQFSDEAAAASSGSPAVSMALNYTPNVKLFLNLAYDRRVGVSAQFASQAYTYNTFSLVANQVVGSSGKWMLRGRVGFTTGDYSSTVAIAGRGFVVTPDGLVEVTFPINNSRTELSYSTSAALIYQPRGWLTSSLTYSFEKYDATFADQYVALTSGLNDFYVNRIILQVTIGY